MGILKEGKETWGGPGGGGGGGGGGQKGEGKESAMLLALCSASRSSDLLRLSLAHRYYAEDKAEQDWAPSIH